MAYTFERPDSPFWWMGYVDETETEKRVSSEILKGIKPRERKESEADALAKARGKEQHAARVRRGEAEPDLVTGATFAQLAERYARERSSGLRSAKSTASRMKHLVAEFGPRLLLSVTSGDIRAFLAKMMRTKTEALFAVSKAGKRYQVSRSGRVLGAGSVEHLRRLLRAMFNFAKEARLVRINPVLPEMEVTVPDAEVRYLDVEQVRLLVMHAPQRWRAFLAVAVFLGLRKGEVIGLRVKNVDMGKGIVTVAHSYNGPPKDDDHRIVPIPPELAPFLKVELGRVRSEYLFPNHEGKMMSMNTKTEEIIRKAAVKAGLIQGFDHLCRRKGCGYLERRADKASSSCPKIPKGGKACGFKLYVRPIAIELKFKDCRSTWATHAYEATKNERFVQDTLGHHDLKITNLYNARRVAFLVDEGSKLSFGISHDSLTPEAELAEEGAEVLRIPQAAGGVTECAILDSNQWPLAPESNGAVFQPAAWRGKSSQVRPIGSLRQSHAGTPESRISLSVTHDRLTLAIGSPTPFRRRLESLRSRYGEAA